MADGTFEKHGLKVTIVPGGPRASNRMLMTVGKLDFYMGGSLIQVDGTSTVLLRRPFVNYGTINLTGGGQWILDMLSVA